MKRFLSLLLLALLVLTGCGDPKPKTDPAELYQGTIEPDKVNLFFLSVGQGDACLMTFPTGERIMIDTGPFESRDRVVDQLHALGVDRLDAVYVTHGHADHTGNLLTLVRRFDVEKVYYGGTESDYGELLEKVRRRGVDCTALLEGDVLSYGENAALFMADATAQAEEYMLFRYHRAELSADVLKVGHHGSPSSSSLRFLQVVSPALSVISVGRYNEYGHPAPEVLLRLALTGTRLLRTDEVPAVQITLDGREARVVE